LNKEDIGWAAALFLVATVAISCIFGFDAAERGYNAYSPGWWDVLCMYIWLGWGLGGVFLCGGAVGEIRLRLRRPQRPTSPR
jgi:hypothetical protein